MKKPTETVEMLEIGSLDQLQKLVDELVPCVFELDGRLVKVPVKRVTAAVEEHRREILRSVPPPPYVKERGEYDALNPVFVKAKEAAEKKARSFLVYSCCPMVAASKPGLVTDDEIHRYVQSLLAENILDLIAITALAGGVNVEVTRRANFTSPPDSEN